MLFNEKKACLPTRDRQASAVFIGWLTTSLSLSCFLLGQNKRPCRA